MGLRPRPAIGFGAICVASTLALGAPSASVAAEEIGGRLSERGLTVVALAPDGRAASARAGGLKFRLEPPSSKSTLHLRKADGRYLGPIVVGRSGKRAIVGVKAGAALGEIKVRRRYAKLTGPLAGKARAGKLWARARKGVPIGAGVFGRIRSRVPDESVPGDLDADGLPNVIDVDDDGDLLLDSLDSGLSPAAVAAAPGVFDISTQLVLPIPDTVNANAGSSDALIDAALPTFGRFGFRVVDGDSVELDCGGNVNPAPPPPRTGGLPYCSTGGTGQVPIVLYPPVGTPFPDDFDLDGDGFGTVTPNPGPGNGWTLLHGATTDQIRTGDVLIQRAVAGEPPQESESAATIEYVFATVPAVASYSDTDVPAHAADVTYPVVSTTGFTVGEGADGAVHLTLTNWRPQRRPIAGESCLEDTPACEWVDIGGLKYTAGIADIGDHGPPPGAAGCPPGAFSESDPNLVPTPISPLTTAGGVTDTAADGAADPAETMTFTLDLDECLAGAPWLSGEKLDLAITASTNSFASLAETAIRFRLE